MNPYTTVGAGVGGLAGGAAGGAAGRSSSLLDLLKPLDYPRQALYNLGRGVSRGLSGDATLDDVLGAVPGALGVIGGGLVGGPLGMLAGAGLAGLGQGVGKLTDRPAFEAATPSDLVGQMGGDPEDFTQSLLAGVATDPLTYAGMGLGAKGGARVGSAVEDARIASRPIAEELRGGSMDPTIRALLNPATEKYVNWGTGKYGMDSQAMEALGAGRTARNEDIAKLIMDRTKPPLAEEFAPAFPNQELPSGIRTGADSQAFITRKLRELAKVGNDAAAEGRYDVLDSLNAQEVGLRHAQANVFGFPPPMRETLRPPLASSEARMSELYNHLDKMSPEDVVKTLRAMARRPANAESLGAQPFYDLAYELQDYGTRPFRDRAAQLAQMEPWSHGLGDAQSVVRSLAGDFPSHMLPNDQVVAMLDRARKLNPEEYARLERLAGQHQQHSALLQRLRDRMDGGFLDELDQLDELPPALPPPLPPRAPGQPGFWDF